VGQKIHPTGFRTGITKTHSTIWFANHSSYSTFLQEDFNIRKFIQQKFKDLCSIDGQSIYDVAGISKLEIRRKVKQLELIIYAARPSAIVNYTDQAKLMIELEKDLKKLTRNSTRIRIKVLHVTRSANESVLVARLISAQLEKRIAFRKVIRAMTKMLKKSGVEGFKIEVSGRLTGAEIARAEWTREGRVPLQTLRAGINYASHRASTKYGILGIKVWIFRKENF
jgi:small subunit ribosomal protein S3